MNLIDKPIRIKHYPKLGTTLIPFIVNVANEREALLIRNALANQHLYLFDNHLIEDYSNVILVEMFENGQWEDYYNNEENLDFDAYVEIHLKEDNEKLQYV